MNAILVELVQRYPELAACREAIREAAQMLIACYQSDGKILLCGNGGSAADAEHWSGELLKGFCRKRPLDQHQRERLPAAMADRLQNALPALPLGSFMSLRSAFANDVDPELAYAQLVWALGRRGDVLVGLSTSGNAANVAAAFIAARAKGMKCLALTGASGGRLRAEGLCDVCIAVAQTETYLVQELHLPVYHALCRIIENHFWSR